MELKTDDEEDSEWDDGILEIEAPSFELLVACEDASGNIGTATAAPEFGDDDEEEEEDGEEEDEDEDEDEDDQPS